MRPSNWLEGLFVSLIGWVIMISVPLQAGGVGLSWDAFNHHIYLGWSANGSRLTMDFMAAGSQSYQYPYLYWPAYKLMALGFSGTVAAVTLCTLQALIIPPLWLISRHLIHGEQWVDKMTRLMTVILGLTSPLVLAVLPTTSNDLLSGVPVMWALALLLSEKSGKAKFLISGALIGLSVAFKLSNAPLVLALTLPILLSSNRMVAKVRQLALLGAGSSIGYIVGYFPWGYQLFRAFGDFYYPISPLDML